MRLLPAVEMREQGEGDGKLCYLEISHTYVIPSGLVFDWSLYEDKELGLTSELAKLKPILTPDVVDAP